MTDGFKLSGSFNLRRQSLTSPTESLNNVQWHISVDTSIDRKFLTVSIHNNNESNLQYFDTNIKINLEYGSGNNLVKTFDFKFDYNNSTFCIKDFLSFEEEYKTLMNETFSIDVVLHFSNISAIQKIAEEIDFCDKNSTFNDVVLKFEDSPDKVIYSSRAMLSIHSKVFNVMFNSDFDDKNKNTIELDDNFEEFKILLNVIYPTKHAINSENIEHLMKLADKYDMSSLMDRCIEFLDNDERIPTELKFLLAEKYSLPKIHNECIQSFNDGKSLEKFQESEVFKNMSDPTKIAVLKRTIKVLSQEKSEEPVAKISRTQSSGQSFNYSYYGGMYGM